MREIFGIPTTSIMVTLVVLFGLTIGMAIAVIVRNRVIFRLGIRNVPRRPAQTILIVIGLMLSTLIISAAFTTGDTLSSSIRGEVLDKTGQTDERVVRSAANIDTGPQYGAIIPQQAVTDLETQLTGSTVIEGVMPLLLESVPGIDTRSNLSEPALTLVGLDPQRLTTFGGLASADGQPIDLADLPEGGIVIGESAADNLDARVGDQLVVYARNAPHTFTIAAIGRDTLTTGYYPGNSGGLALPLDRAQSLLGYEGFVSSIEVTNRGGVESGVTHTDAALRELDTALVGTPYRAIDSKRSDLDQAELAGNVYMSIFLVFGLFSIAVGVLLIFLIFVMLAAERRAEMGMARAVGMKRRHLTEMFVAEGIAYDLVAALVGATLGVGVAFLMAGWMGRLVGQYMTIHPSASWQGLIIAYTLGGVVTFVTIAVSAWRVSRLNIVGAIRDVAEVPEKRASRRWLLFGILGMLSGALLIGVGASARQQAPYLLGLSLAPFALAMVLRRVGLSARLLYSIASVFVLFVWIGPRQLTAHIYPDELSGGIEMFFISGMMLVAAATLLIVWNATVVTAFIAQLGKAFSRWLPAVKTSVAYPMERKGRTGMTIAMFSLVIFALVMMAAINSNAWNMMLGSEHVSGGWDVLVTQTTTNPLGDLRQTLDQHGGDANAISDTAALWGPTPGHSRVRMAGDGNWVSYGAWGLSNDFIDRSDLPLQTRASGYADDGAVWDAVRDNPDLAIVDANTIASSASFGNVGAFVLEGVTTDDSVMQPTRIELNDPTTGATRTLSVIGVLDSSVGAFGGVFMSQPTFTQLYPAPGVNAIVVKLQPGLDAKHEAQQIEATLVTYGAQASSFKAMLDEASRTSRGFMQIVEGFMLLGLVVGIAALGVISFRSVVERRQQIGMLRAIGYRRSMVAASFMIESTMVTILGVLSGTILGLALARQLMTSEYFFGSSEGVRFTAPWLQVILFIAVALVAAVLMAWIPARRAAGVPIAEALRYE